MIAKLNKMFIAFKSRISHCCLWWMPQCA